MTEHIKQVVWNIDKHNKNFKSLKDEQGNNFFYYLTMLNLQNDPDLLILSPVHHYYYDFKEIKNVNTIIQIKQLNKLTDINVFLYNVCQALSSKMNFIGCFKDNKIYGLGEWLYNKLDGKPNHYLSRKKIIKLFEKHDLNILDLTEFDNLTYFHVKKISKNGIKI